MSVLVAATGVAVAQEVVPARLSKFSGKIVPRFEVLKYAAVNGRAGPSREHPILWRYEREGLPLLIIKESRDWRRVRDPDGDEVWVHARMLEAGHSGLVQIESFVYREASFESERVARLEAGVLVETGRCDARWCEVKAGSYKGWAPEEVLWGVDPGETSL